MEYFGPERVFANDFREGMLVFSDEFKFGKIAPQGADYTVEVDGEAEKDECNAYDPSRVTASYRVEKLTVCDHERNPRTGAPAFGDHMQVIAVRLDASGNPTPEKILFRVASFVTFCLEYVYGGKPSGGYMSENGGLCLRGDLAEQEELLSYFLRDYATGGNQIILRRKALSFIRRLQERVSKYIDLEKDKPEYKLLHDMCNSDEVLAYFAQAAARKGLFIDRMIARENPQAPIEQFVNIVPVAIEQIGGVFKITCFIDARSCTPNPENKTIIWWSRNLSDTLPGTGIVFLAANRFRVPGKGEFSCDE